MTINAPISIQTVEISSSIELSPSISITAPIRLGSKGDPGFGVPSGGLDGQVLTKLGTQDYSTLWSSLNDFTLQFENSLQ